MANLGLLSTFPTAEELFYPDAPVRVIVKKSNIAEAKRGVFVTTAVHPRDYLCYYHGNETKDVSKCEASYFMAFPGWRSNGIVGFIAPRTPLGVAQIINDMASLNIFTNFPYLLTVIEQIHFILQAMLRYCEQAKRCNVLHGLEADRQKTQNQKVIALCHFYAFKKLNPGDELYWSYGLEYWISEAISKIMGSTESLAVVCRALLLAQQIYERQRQSLHTFITENAPKLLYSTTCLSILMNQSISILALRQALEDLNSIETILPKWTPEETILCQQGKIQLQCLLPSPVYKKEGISTILHLLAEESQQFLEK